jgi:ElaB/YqjD/DUF883 family membrane-anchored ribosome-binding protein
MRTLLGSAALILLVGCASQGDVIELHSRQVAMSGELEMMKRDTKAALDRMEELQRQIQRTLKDNDEKLNKIFEALRERRELIPSRAPGQAPSPTP